MTTLLRFRRAFKVAKATIKRNLKTWATLLMKIMYYITFVMYRNQADGAKCPIH